MIQIVAFLFFILLGIGVGWYFGSRESDDDFADSSFIPFGARCRFLMWAWGIAAFATVLVEIPLLLFFPWFPLGLVCLFYNKDNDGHSHLFMAVGWFFYTFITVSAMMTKRRQFYFLIYGLLCLLLILNVIGCHQILRHVQ